MFLKNWVNSFYRLDGDRFLGYLNAENLPSSSRAKIKKMDKMNNNSLGWQRHKSFVLWTWVNKNFLISESFINHFNKNVKKLDIVLTSREEAFLFAVKGLNFASWRPMKEMIVRFPLEKKEVIYFSESNGNLYEVIERENEKTIREHVLSGDFYFSNRMLYVCEKDQTVRLRIKFENISNVQLTSFGIRLTVGELVFLIRTQNKFMSYVIFQRLLPNLNLDINKIDNLYNYFDFWNKLLIKFN